MVSFQWASPTPSSAPVPSQSQSLTTSRLILRPINPDTDAEDVLRMRANPNVTTYLYPRSAPEPTLADVKQRLHTTLANNTIFFAITIRGSSSSPLKPLRAINAQQTNNQQPAQSKPRAWRARSPPTNASCAFTDRSSQIVIGTIGITSTHELGYVLDEPFWGQGITAEALGAAVKLWLSKVTSPSRLPEQPGLEKWRQLRAISNIENAGSMRVLEKCGFEKVLLREAEDFNDIGATVDMWEWRLGRKAANSSREEHERTEKIRLMGSGR